MLTFMRLVAFALCITVKSSKGVFEGVNVRVPFKDVSSLKRQHFHDHDDLDRCMPIREPVCQGLQYTSTKMPNWIKMTSQEEAAKRVIDYQSLLKINCSHYLKLFLCTVYFPMCTQLEKPTSLRPCMPLCLHVRSRCEPIMKQFKFEWPDELNCAKLPEPPELCIEPPANYSLDPVNAHLGELPRGVGVAHSDARLESLRRMYPQLDEIMRQRSDSLDQIVDQAAKAIDKLGIHYNNFGLDNRGLFRVSPADKLFVCTGGEISLPQFSNGTCLSICGAHLFYQATDKTFARSWLFSWSLLCLVSSAMTLLAFFTEPTRILYPERPVLYLVACYFAISMAQILQFSLGVERVTCRSIELHNGAPESYKYLLKAGQEGAWCSIGFLVTYYFGMASSFWWVMLGLAWYLSTSRKWSHEGVESVSSLFHLFAWALPAIQAILILILHKIDADELTGTCFTGNFNDAALLFGVIVPQLACLLVGLTLLSVGFVAVHRVHRNLKDPRVYFGEHSANRRRLERLIAKLAVFALLYTIPMLCLLAGWFYQYASQETWRQALRELHSRRPHCQSSRGVAWGIPDCRPITSPHPEVAMLRIFMSLVVGITSGMWVWANRKTFLIWCRLFKREPARPCVERCPLSLTSPGQLQSKALQPHHNSLQEGGAAASTDGRPTHTAALQHRSTLCSHKMSHPQAALYNSPQIADCHCSCHRSILGYDNISNPH